MDPLSVRIQRSSARSHAAENTPRDDFYIDLQNGFCAYVAHILSSSIPSFQPSPDVTGDMQAPSLIHLEPPARLQATGCWCPNPSRPRPHYWRTCTRFVPQSVVAPSAVPQPCPHPRAQPVGTSDIAIAMNPSRSGPPEYFYDPADPPATATVEHLFCFNPLAAAASYTSWLLAVGGPPETPLEAQDADELRGWLAERYYTGNAYRGAPGGNPYAVARSGGQVVADVSDRWDAVPSTEEQADAHLAALARVLLEIRGAPPGSKRCGCWYDAERVHRVVRWDLMPVRDAMAALLPFVTRAKGARLTNPGRFV